MKHFIGDKDGIQTQAGKAQWISNRTTDHCTFFCTKPISDQESHDHWVTRLKTKGRECDFDKMDLKEAIKLVVTLYTPLPKLQTAIIRDDMSFDNMMKAARAMESAEREAEYMKSNNLEHTKAPTDDTFDLNKLSKHAERQGMRLIPKPKSSSVRPRTKMVELCRYCGDPYPHKGTCKAKGTTRKNCGKKNHFARVCESKKIDKLYKEPITESDGTVDYDYDSKEIHLDKMTALCSVSGRKYPSTMIDVSINSTILKMEVDSGEEAML